MNLGAGELVNGVEEDEERSLGGRQLEQLLEVGCDRNLIRENAQNLLSADVLLEQTVSSGMSSNGSMSV